MRDAVDAHLDTLGNLAQPPLSQALDRAEFVHFMSLTVVRDSSGGLARLVLEAAADGYPGGVLGRLAREIGSELCRVLDVAGIPVTVSQLGEFLVRHDRQVGQGWFAVPGVVFTGTPGMTVGRIRLEAELASRIEKLLDNLPPQGSALATLERVRGHLFSEAAYKWAFAAEPVPLLADAPKGWSFRSPCDVVGAPHVPLASARPPRAGLVWKALWAVAFLWSLLVLPALGFVWKGLWAAILTLGAELVFAGIAARIAYTMFRRKEKADAQTTGRRPRIRGRNHGAREPVHAEPPGGGSTMKPGWLRHLALRLALWVVGAFAAYRSRPGFLSNIGTIHFARWILLPGTTSCCLLRLHRKLGELPRRFHPGGAQRADGRLEQYTGLSTHEQFGAGRRQRSRSF